MTPLSVLRPLTPGILPALVASLLSTACAGGPEPPDPPLKAPAATASEVAPPAVELPADTAFGALILRLSERGRYFDTDNLISNESSYLHVLDALAERGLEGGAFIGVGPDQSFSYIARLRPRLAFMIDIRRDNLLQHLFFKALFEVSETRLAYLCNLFALPLPDRPEEWLDRDLEALVAYADARTPVQERIDEARSSVAAAVAGFGLGLSDEDLETIAYIHTRFISDGLDLRFNSHNRPPQPYYPTFRRLLLETDRAGRQGNYLAREDDYRFLKKMQEEDRLIPVVGDLGGTHAMREIGRYLREQDLSVTGLYTSNVEYYLMGDRLFDAFCENSGALPRHPDGVIIRSYFNRYRSAHPETRPGYASTQLLQSLDGFARRCAGDGYPSYGSLVMDYIESPS